MTHVPPFERKVLAQIITLEGGFTPPNHKSGDPLTLFGVTDKVWARETNQTLAHAQAEMEKIGRLCQPYSNPDKTRPHQPKSGMPLRSHAVQQDGLNATEKKHFQAGYDKAAEILFHTYLQTPGFDKYPPFIQIHLFDFTVNKGPSRARWALTEAMHDAHILPDTAYKKLHHLTAKQAVDDQIFRPLADGSRSPAGWYGSRDADALLLPYLQHLSAPQEASLIKAYGKKRCDYYHARAETDKPMAEHLDGWLKRVDTINALSLSKDIALPPHTDTHPAQPTHPGNKHDAHPNKHHHHPHHHR